MDQHCLAAFAINVQRKWQLNGQPVQATCHALAQMVTPTPHCSDELVLCEDA